MKDAIYHNSHDSIYRNPFGAIESGKTLSIAVSVSESICPEAVFLNIIEKDKKYDLSMNYLKKQDGFVYYIADMNTDGYMGLVFYHFTIHTPERIFLYGNNPKQLGGEGCFYKDNPKGFQVTVYKKPYPIPNWFQEAIVYQIFPDRFYNKSHPIVKNPKVNSFIYGNWEDEPFYIKDKEGKVVRWDFFGGNIEGIIEKLPYLGELGINAIYLNPIFEARSNHRYDTGDYKKIDPMLGEEKDFIELCKKAGAMGIKIILDGVFSHTGDDSIYFNRYGSYPELGAYQSKNSKYYEWYQFEEDMKGYKCWWGVDALPNVNEMEPSYIGFIINDKDGVIGHWMDKGVMGWRLDVADELPDEFIRLLKDKVKAVDPDSILIGEVWEDASNKISYEERREFLYGDELDSVTNYPLRKVFIDFIKNDVNAKEVHGKVMSLYENYPKHYFYSCLNLISGHDVPRILTIFEDKFKDEETVIKAMKIIILMQMTFPGVPCIYYGDEAGVRGFTDPDNRRTYPWGKENKEILSFYKEMIALRKSSDIFIKGDFESFYIDDVYGYKRSLKDEVVFVFVNPAHVDKNIIVSGIDKKVSIPAMSYEIVQIFKIA